MCACVCGGVCGGGGVAVAESEHMCKKHNVAQLEFSSTEGNRGDQRWVASLCVYCNTPTHTHTHTTDTLPFSIQTRALIRVCHSVRVPAAAVELVSNILFLCIHVD